MQALLSPLLVAALAASPAGEVALPLELDVAGGTRTVSLALERAQVEVRIERRGKPRLRARLLPSADAAAPAPVLEVEQGRSSLVLRRPPVGDDPEAPRIAVELVLDPRQQLELRGRELGVRISASGGRRGRAEKPAGDAPATEAALPAIDELPPPALTLQLAASELDLDGLDAGSGRLDLRAEDSTITLRRTRGPLLLEVRGGSLDGEDHDGLAMLTAAGAEVRLAGYRGPLAFTTRGGRLGLVERGDGVIEGRAEGGGVALDGWTGRATLEGSGAQIDVAGGEQVELRVRGKGLDVTADRLQGSIEAELTGGRLHGARLAGKIEISARAQAAIDLSDLGERLDLILVDEASARVTDLDGWLEARLDGAGLEVDGARHLTVRGERATVVADRIPRLETVSLRDSRVELDLTLSEQDLAVALKGASSGRIRLAMPCIAAVAADRDTLDSRVHVAGCALASRNNPILARDPETVRLVVSVDKDGELDVEGVP
ncbi:MAG: hypothetical protein D6696_12340 [Acidobacteria bacterium]|nr:MAG: hypothetical protein D6696_12340 [Acidobacteriota bacterium]